ncbi:hypothetical protein Mapa_007643 [Marchantia paleacea]|nr:hypothetical protein Mapa_007643 [Marchantia paleacea]
MLATIFVCDQNSVKPNQNEPERSETTEMTKIPTNHCPDAHISTFICIDDFSC